MDNIYYSPEKFGLSIVGMVQDGDLSYEFDMFVVWKDKKTGRLYCMNDSGCSCPAPFEDYRDKTELNPIRTIGAFQSVLAEWNRRYKDYPKADAGKIGELERAVAIQLRNLARRRKRKQVRKKV